MCDYSLAHIKSRAADTADKLIVKDFGMYTRGFADVSDASKPAGESTAICVLPGTEIGFDKNIVVKGPWGDECETPFATAIFRQKDTENLFTHHDVLEFPDGSWEHLTKLVEGQTATILQLPAKPKTEAEAKAQERVAVFG